MLFRAAIFVALGLLACSETAEQHSHSDSGHEAPAPGTPEVEYLTETTDEALARLLDAVPTTEGAPQLVLDSPTTTELASDTPVEFSFHVTESARQRRAAPRSNGPLADFPPWARYALRELGGLLGPVRCAHAHGTPYNGVAYYLVFSDADGTPLARVFTGLTSYTPSAAAWATWAQAPGPLQLTITWATFEENEVLPDLGPFEAGPFEFSWQ